MGSPVPAIGRILIHDFNEAIYQSGPTYRIFTIEPSDMAQGVELASGEGGLFRRVLSGLV